MKPFLILQYSYESIEIAVCYQGTILESISEHKFNAVKLTIPHIHTLLQKHNLSLSDLSCIGVNVGPGPYNSLRALITTANGFHFVNKIPLIPSNALDLLVEENKTTPLMVILHAFSGHVFYALKTKTEYDKGACSVDELVQIIKSQSEPITIVGNGAILHKTFLQETTQNVIVPDNIPSFNSLDILAQETYKKLQTSFHENYLQPIYFEDLAHEKA